MEAVGANKERPDKLSLEQVLDKLSKRERQVVEEEMQRLEERAGYDSLLEKEGVLNRRGLYKEMNREFKRLKRGEREELVVVMWDVDFFKLINDQFGHAFGDKMLKDVAKSMLEEARETDVVGRVGGDELVQLMPVGKSEEGFGINGSQLEERLGEIGQAMAEKIQRREEQITEEWPQKEGRKAGEISFGYKRWDWAEVERKQEEWGDKAGEEELYQKLTKKADEELMKVKRGR